MSEIKDLIVEEGNSNYSISTGVPMSGWACYMFGNKPDNNFGICYYPAKGTVPNWFVRWMMKICFACTWVKEDEPNSD